MPGYTPVNRVEKEGFFQLEKELMERKEKIAEAIFIRSVKALDC